MKKKVDLLSILCVASIVLVNYPFIDLGKWGGMIVIFIMAWFIPRSADTFCSIHDLRTFCALPILCVMQATIFLLIGESELKYLSRGMSTSISLMADIYLGYKMVRYWGAKAFDILFIGLTLSYSIIVVSALIVFGWAPVWESLFSLFSNGVQSVSRETDRILESCHAILLIMPFISLLYFISFSRTKVRAHLAYAIIAIVISLLAYKRIAIGAAVVLFVVYMFHRLYGRRLIVVCGLIGISILLWYIWFIKSRMIYDFALIYDIDLNYRDVIWPKLESLYKFTVDFAGNGWGFMGKYLHEHNRIMFGNSLGGIHNDILKVFIDLGFIGFIVYFGYLLIYTPLKLRFRSVSLIYWLCQIFLMVTYLTDNTMIYPSCQLVAYISPYCIIKDDKTFL